MSHAPAWHLLDSNFTDKNQGISVPERWVGLRSDIPFAVARTAESLSHANTLTIIPGALRIENLDRADPPNYKAGDFPRADAFNNNVLSMSADPHMPSIDVKCALSGFDPTKTPIFWRLQCLHQLCRHYNSGLYRYVSSCEKLEAEWQGRARAANFTLFDPNDANVLYDHGGGARERVMGGHGLLSVAVRIPGMAQPLLDYVHLRIGGANPGAAHVLTFLGNEIGARDQNIQHMVRAVFAHESNYRQFATHAQTRSSMTFRQRHHQNDAHQPDCAVAFDWPDDPSDFPLVTFDFGIGISQYTRTASQAVTAGIVWDWRENIKKGVNVFISKMRATYPAGGGTWRQWALRAWSAYNGSGPQAAAYAQQLLTSPEGHQVNNTAVPALGTLGADLAPLVQRAAAGPAPGWPPPP